MPRILIGGELTEPAAAPVIELEPGVFSVLRDGESFEVRISPNEATIAGYRFPFEVQDPRRWKRAQSGLSASGPVAIVASMPGKIVRYLVSVGDPVEAGQGIVVVEAMKMQNELKSPRAGRVTALKAAPNNSVIAGAVLALVE